MGNNKVIPIPFCDLLFYNWREAAVLHKERLIAGSFHISFFFNEDKGRKPDLRVRRAFSGSDKQIVASPNFGRVSSVTIHQQ